MLQNTQQLLQLLEAHAGELPDSLRDALRRSLQENDYLLSALNAHDIVSIADSEGDIIEVNEKFCAVSGYTREELIGSNHRIVNSGTHTPAFFARMWRTISHGHIWHGVLCNRNRGGNLYWVDSTIVPFLDAAGKPYQYVSVRTDITAHKLAEERLRYSEDRLRQSQVYANIGTWDWNIQTGDLYWSERIAPLFGYLEGKLETTYENFLNAVHPDDRQQVIDAVAACVEAGRPYEIEHRCVWPSGEIRWLLERGDVVRDAGGRPLHMLGVVQDITDRKAAELALRENRERLQEAQRIAHLGHWVAELDSGSLYWSDEVYRIFGQTPGEYVPNVDRFHAMVHPDDAALVRESERRAATSGVHDVVHRIVRPSGEIRYVRELAETAFDDQGVPLRLIGTVQDITALKETELQLITAKEAAERANRAKSEFLSSMSHELRTPMNAILGFSQLLESEPDLAPVHGEYVGEILKAGFHLLELINEVLDLATIEAGHLSLSLEPVSCAEVISECIEMMMPLASRNRIELHWQDCPGVYLHADRVRLKQVLINLLSNAIKYHHPGGQVQVRVVRKDAARVRVMVQDNGPGIPPERQGALFQPFQRLGAEGGVVEGTGIGLVLSKRLVEAMRGRIGCDSRVGEGSLFWVELPVAECEALPEEDAAVADQIDSAEPRPESRVLYIEDNPANLRLMQQIFCTRRACKLLDTHSAELGLALAIERKPKLILLDINLPGMNGYEILSRLRAHPATRAIPVIAITANAMPHNIAQGELAGFDGYLTKPIDVRKLLETVDRLLSEAM